jgi:hypothetical protein
VGNLNSVGRSARRLINSSPRTVARSGLSVYRRLTDHRMNLSASQGVLWLRLRHEQAHHSGHNGGEEYLPEVGTHRSPPIRRLLSQLVKVRPGSVGVCGLRRAAGRRAASRR